MKCMVKWLFIIFGVAVWASCSQLTNFDLPGEDAVSDPVDVDAVDVDAEDVNGEETITPGCGNGIKDEGEECDDGNSVEGDGCDNDCTYSCHDNSECMDGEQCNGDETCNTSTHICEEGTAQEDGFVCENDPRSICIDGVCGESICGDDFVDEGGGEFCDPPSVGNCNADCKWVCEVNSDCPDDENMCNGEEYCDTDAHECARRNAPADGTECSADPRQICIAGTCQDSTCGDEYIDPLVDPAEECDDGNDINGDGCENDCTYSCHVDPDCDDDEICNGAETCDTETTHMCQAGTNADSGTACDDGLFCTLTDECDGSGACAGTGDTCADTLDCTENEACNETDDLCTFDIVAGNCLIGGACYADTDDNPANECQECVAATSQTEWTNKGDGTACTDDGLTCTEDTCQSGACDHSAIAAGACYIDSTCYANGDDNPANECQECVAATSQTAWTNKTDGTACTDDGLTCTEDTCQSGTCDHSTVTAGNCLIGGTCYADGVDDPGNECQECVAATSQTAWTNKTDGTVCTDDGVSCTVDECQSGACDHTTITAGSCYIDSTCYIDGNDNPGNECQVCDPGTSQSVWTNKSDGTLCNGGAGTCTGGVCT